MRGQEDAQWIAPVRDSPADAGWVRSPDSPKSPRHRDLTLQALQGCTGDLALPLTSTCDADAAETDSATR